MILEKPLRTEPTVIWGAFQVWGIFGFGERHTPPWLRDVHNGVITGSPRRSRLGRCHVRAIPHPQRARTTWLAHSRPCFSALGPPAPLGHLPALVLVRSRDIFFVGPQARAEASAGGAACPRSHGQVSGGVGTAPLSSLHHRGWNLLEPKLTLHATLRSICLLSWTERLWGWGLPTAPGVPMETHSPPLRVVLGGAPASSTEAQAASPRSLCSSCHLGAQNPGEGTQSFPPGPGTSRG